MRISINDHLCMKNKIVPKPNRIYWAKNGERRGLIRFPNWFTPEDDKVTVFSKEREIDDIFWNSNENTWVLLKDVTDHLSISITIMKARSNV